MLVNFDQQLKDQYGEPMVDRQLVDDESGAINAPPHFKSRKMTLALICSVALFSSHPEEKPRPDVNETRIRFNLANKVSEGGDKEITIEEAQRIKNCVNHSAPSPLIWGQVDKIFEEATKNQPPAGGRA